MAKTARQGTFPGMEPDETPDETNPPRPQSAREPRAADKPAGAARASAAIAETAAPRPASLKGKSVWVVDANSLIFQVFHALPEMTSPRGEPVSAVFGFSRDMLYLLEEQKPDYLFVAFDGTERTFRHEVYEAYKAHREEMPVDLVPQYGPIRRLLAALGVPIIEFDAYEADDILATLARLTTELGGDCYLVTGDKDARQLIGEHVKIYNVRKNELYGPEALLADWGVRPEQVVDFQALVGDPVDNVPGVPLIGPKMAGEYLQKYGTLDELLARADELLKGKRRDNLIALRDQALLSRRLARLEQNVPVPIEWNAAKVEGVDARALAELFSELGFRTLAQKYSAIPRRAAASPWQADYQLVATPERLAWLVNQMSRQQSVSIDTETTDRRPRFAEIVGYSFAWNEGQAYYVPVRAPAGEPRLEPAETLALLRPILENPAIEKVGQNLKYDMVVLASVDVKRKSAS
jgi:DNA polymerase-1